MELFFADLTADAKVGLLSVDESKHVRVLRKKLTNTIQLINGKGLLFEARLVGEKKSQFLFEILGVEQKPKPPQLYSLMIPMLKQDARMEWLLEKGTELGCNSFLFTQTERAEKAPNKLDRLVKIMIAALKQSQQFYLPEINYFQNIKSLTEQYNQSQFLIAHCGSGLKVKLNSQLPAKQHVVLGIGPEGDFTPEELLLFPANNTKFIDLGGTRLRSETAALYALSLAKLAYQ